MADEVTPKNILMIGPTGVGKTEIARRLARLAQSPFIKVEASKFTEVGYVGRDVESMVRDLVELAVDMVRAEKAEEVQGQGARRRPRSGCSICCCRRHASADAGRGSADRRASRRRGTRERMREQLRDGRLDERVVEIDVRETAMPSFEIIAGTSVEEIGVNLKDMMGNMFHGRTKTRRLKVPRGARAPGRRGAGQAGRHGVGQPHRGPARRAGRHHLHRRDRQDRQPRRRAAAATAPTSAARACSATSCRSSRARPSTPSTGW